MDPNKRLEKIFGQLERLQTPFNRLRRQLEALKREDKWESITVARLERALEELEWETNLFRREILFGYGKVSPGREALFKRFGSQVK